MRPGFTDDELVDLRCRVLGGRTLDEDTVLDLIDQLRDADDRDAADDGYGDRADHCDGCMCDEEDEEGCYMCGATGCLRIGHDHSDHLEYDEGARTPAENYEEAREFHRRFVQRPEPPAAP